MKNITMKFPFLLPFFILLFSTLLSAADSCTSNHSVTLNSSNATYNITDTSSTAGKLFYINVTEPGTVTINLTTADTMQFEYSLNSCPTDTDNGQNSASLNFSAADDFNLIVYSGNAAPKAYTLTITFTPSISFTCANPKTFTPVYSGDSYSKLVQIGNTSLCKNNGSGVCSDPGIATNNDINMMHNDYDDVNGTADNSSTLLNSSAALLDIPVGKNVLWAGLFWQGYMVNWSDAQKEAGRSIKYKHADDTAYQTESNAQMNWVYFDADRFYYQSFIDITSYVNSSGPGYYWVGDIATTEGQPAGGSFGAWSIAVVYQDTDEEFRNTTVFHGYQALAGSGDITSAVTYATDNSCDTSNTGLGTEVSSTLTGFLTPKSGDVNSTLIVFTGEGDIGLDGDSGSVTNKAGTEYALTNTLNPSNNIMNATISKDGATVTTGLPYYSANTLGADIDTYTLNGVLDNEQSSTIIKFITSGDGYMPGLYALETKLYEPGFCYDYAYKQQGVYFTEENDGTQDPKISSDSIIQGEPIEVSIFLRNLVDSDIVVSNMYVDILDINTTQADYVGSSTKLAKIGALTPLNLTDVVGDGTDPAEVSIGTDSSGDFIKDVTIGTIDSNEHFYIYYSIDPKTTSIDMPLSVQAKYDLVILGETIPYTLNISGQIPMCSGGSNLEYSPGIGRFNVVHNEYYTYDPVTNPDGTKYYNLPTQITSREGNFKVIAMDLENLDELQGQSVSVAVEMIDASRFHDTYTSCQEEESAISEKVQVFFDTNATSVPFDKEAIQFAIDNATTDLTNTSDFYKTASENTAFRVSYGLTNDGTDGLVQHSYNESTDEYNILNFTQLVQDIGTCVQPVNYKDATITENVAVACGNAAQQAAPLTRKHYYACLQCLYGINTRFDCSRDNFSIRPEAFMIKIDDQNQTDPTSQLRIADSVSGVVTPLTTQVELAAGYEYNLSVAATNHLTNDASPGYTKSYDPLLSDNVVYNWQSSGVTSGCNDDTNHSIEMRFVDGLVDINSSLNQVGEYGLNITDKTWTTVDNTQPAHHTGEYFLPGADCVVNTSTTQPVNSPTLNGCNISSNHDSSGSNLKYRDYNLEFHPYKFNMGIVPSHGLDNNTTFSADTFIYMADIAQDQNMSFHLNGNIDAVGFNGVKTTNFVDNCYAEPITLKINKSAISSAVAHQYRFNNTDITANSQNGDINGTIGIINLNTDDFNKTKSGTVNTNLNLNFNRSSSAVMNPEIIRYSTYTSNCTTAANCNMNADLTIKDTDGNITLDQNITHYYGRAHASRQRYEGATGTANIYYEAYCFNTIGGNDCNKSLLQQGVDSKRSDDIRWYINENHTSNEGNAGKVVEKDSLDRVTVAGTTSGNHPDTSTLMTYDGSRGYPYKTTMEHNASGWLIYNEDNPTATKNQFAVEFDIAGTGWSGAHETNTTTDDPGTAKVNRRSMW